MDTAQYWFQAGDYQIERSLRFNSADSAYLVNSSTRTVAAGAYTFSFWIKRCALGNTETIWSSEDASYASNKLALAGFGSDNIFYWWHYSGADANAAQSNGVLRDTSAWYHIVLSKPASAAGTLYINGVAQTKRTSFTADADAFANAKYIGRRYDGTRYSNCYLTEFYGIDGQALTPSSFGEINPVTGVWQPKKYTGTYGTNGFYLNFADNSGTTSTTLGKDSSGNGNNWTPNNFSVTTGSGNDSLIDTPTPYADGGNGRGNYCTWNPINTAAALSNGNLDIASLNDYVFGSVQVTSGKWYWEYTINGGSSYNYFMGVSNSTASTYVGMGMANGGNSPDIFNILTNTNGTKTSPTGSRPSQPATIGIKLDINAGSVEFYINGTLNGSVTGVTNWPSGSFWTPWISNYTGTFGYQAIIANFGQRPFAYTPPSGFLALNTQNLPEPTIKKPSSYMDVLTWTGNGSAQTISSLGFSPDFIWIKDRNTARSHYLANSIIGGNNYLSSNSTSQELTTTEGVKSITSNGFTLGYALLVNNTSETYAAWCWDKSATPGFDIVTYTGTGSNQNISHSLGVAPSLLIVKNRTSGTPSWRVWHSTFTVNDYIYLDSTNAKLTGGGVWTALPTSTQFSINGADAGVGANGNNYVAYLWSEVAGFSKFGSYTGNGSADGPFVYCGFRPRWVMVKGSSLDSHWYTFDAARNESNVTSSYLYPNLSHAEYAEPCLDFTSNGFKWRNYSAAFNAPGHTYIFAAFAESPFKYSLAR